MSIRGFADHPDDFHIDRYEIDKDQGVDGHVEIEPVESMQGEDDRSDARSPISCDVADALPTVSRRIERPLCVVETSGGLGGTVRSWPSSPTAGWRCFGGKPKPEMSER